MATIVWVGNRREISQMNTLTEVNISCPYCGESIDILVDYSVGAESYIEDCQVCCRPIDIEVGEDDLGYPMLRVSHENDA